MTRLAATLTTAQAQLKDAVTGRLNRAARRDTGATLIEYVVIVGGVCLLALALVALIGRVVATHSADIK